MAFDASAFLSKLTGWYSFDNDDGENDHDPGVNVATVRGSYITGHVGRGTSHHGRFNRDLKFPRTSTFFGMAGWLKVPGGTSTPETISNFSLRPRITKSGSALILEGYWNFTFQALGTFVSDYDAIQTSWNHVAYSYDDTGGTDSFRMWLNGSSVATGNNSSSDTPSSDNGFYGNNQPATNHELNTDTMVNIANAHFTDDEITWLYNSGDGRSYSELSSQAPAQNAQNNNMRNIRMAP